MNIKYYIGISFLVLASCKTAETSNTSSFKTKRNEIEIEKKVDALIQQMSLDEKVSLCHANSKFAIAGIERLGIKEMWMSDGPHGVREEISRDSWKPAGWTNDFSTYLPPLTAVAASWNPEIAYKHGMVLGSEARERKKDVILGPGVNMARNPHYGRNFEYMGEDPYLASKLVVPEIIAIQENDVAACIKHFALNEQELNRHHVNAMPSDRTLREIYLPPFEAAVKEANVWTAMGAYNQYYGTNCNQSKKLVMDILKGEYKFKGLLMTDWDCDINTYDAAINGLDIEMGTRAKSYDDYFLANPFKEQLKSGKIPMSILDDKVRRILRVQQHIGMMDDKRLPGERNSDRNRKYAKDIISEGVVLLKNENNILPLKKEVLKKVLVIGPTADTPHGHGGGSSQVKSDFEITPLQGIKNYLGPDVEIEYVKAAPPKEFGLGAIAPDFVITKQSGAGTPAWKRFTYENDDFTQKGKFDWLNESKITFSDKNIHYERMNAEIEPMKSGKHKFMIEGNGRIKLSINNKVVIPNKNVTLNNYEVYEMELNKGERYVVQLDYAGTDRICLGWEAPGSMYLETAEYLAKAKQADLVYFVGGLDHSLDREAGDRPNIKLPYNQDHTISELLKVQPNTVILMVAGSAVEMPWFKDAKAVIWGWYGGMFAGEVYTEVLFGKINPSGKMPISLPKSEKDYPHVQLNDYNEKECLYKEGIFMGYRWFEEKNIKTEVPFGYGLSYTSFKYSDLNITPITENGVAKISFKITNIGNVAGKEIAQLYIKDDVASVERPNKELKGFQKVSLNVGETKEVTLTLTQRDLSFWDEKTNNWNAEKGSFTIMIGENINSIKLEGKFQY